MGDAGVVDDWPWQEYVREGAELHPDNIQVKRDILAEYGEDNIRRSWIEVCKKLEAVSEEIKTKGTSIIREFSYEEFFNMSEEEKEAVKESGCVVVRGTIPSELATEWFEWMKTYMEDNKGVITGM